MCLAASALLAPSFLPSFLPTCCDLLHEAQKITESLFVLMWMPPCIMCPCRSEGNPGGDVTTPPSLIWCGDTRRHGRMQPMFGQLRSSRWGESLAPDRTNEA